MGKLLKSEKTYSLEELIGMIEKLPSEDRIRLIQTIVSENGRVETHFASEKTLAKDWLSLEEDEAWKNL